MGSFSDRRVSLAKTAPRKAPLQARPAPRRLRQQLRFLLLLFVFLLLLTVQFVTESSAVSVDSDKQRRSKSVCDQADRELEGDDECSVLFSSVSHLSLLQRGARAPFLSRVAARRKCSSGKRRCVAAPSARPGRSTCARTLTLRPATTFTP